MLFEFFSNNQRTILPLLEPHHDENSRSIHHSVFYMLDKTLDYAYHKLLYIPYESVRRLLQTNSMALDLDRRQTSYPQYFHLHHTFQNIANWHVQWAPLDF